MDHLSSHLGKACKVDKLIFFITVNHNISQSIACKVKEGTLGQGLLQDTFKV